MPTIDFTTFNEDTLRNFKPVLAKSVLPSWWKKMKVFQSIRGRRTQTIRACPAMHDWTKSGWYLLANRDIEVLCGSDRESLSNENEGLYKIQGTRPEYSSFNGRRRE